MFPLPCAFAHSLNLSILSRSEVVAFERVLGCVSVTESSDITEDITLQTAVTYIWLFRPRFAMFAGRGYVKMFT